MSEDWIEIASSQHNFDMSCISYIFCIYKRNTLF